MALLHRDRAERDTRLGDERLMGDPPVGGPATVDRDVNSDRELLGERDRDVYSDRPVAVTRPRSDTFGIIVRTVIFTLAIAAIVVVATQNEGDVRFDMVFEQYSTPLWVVMVLPAALGCIAGLMVRSGRRDNAERF
jgi:uncharacterized integral membrane protein